MDLAPYVSDLRSQLAAAAEPGGPEARDLADRLTATLDSAFRLALLDALSVATAEITQELAPGSVELRLRGRDHEFVVVVPAPQAVAEPADDALPVAADSPMTRINLRLGQDLKGRVEEAARRDGTSVNSWLVRAATSALGASAPGFAPSRRSAHGSDRYSGWVR